MSFLLPILAHYTSFCIVQSMSSISISTKKLLQRPREAVPTSRNSWKRRLRRPKCHSTNHSESSSSTSIKVFGKPAHKRTVVCIWIFVESFNSAYEPTGNDESNLTHVTECTYKVLGLSTQTIVIYLRTIFDCVTVDLITAPTHWLSNQMPKIMLQIPPISPLRTSVPKLGSAKAC